MTHTQTHSNILYKGRGKQQEVKEIQKHVYEKFVESTGRFGKKYFQKSHGSVEKIRPQNNLVPKIPFMYFLFVLNLFFMLNEGEKCARGRVKDMTFIPRA